MFLSQVEGRLVPDDIEISGRERIETTAARADQPGHMHTTYPVSDSELVGIAESAQIVANLSRHPNIGTIVDYLGFQATVDVQNGTSDVTYEDPHEVARLLDALNAKLPPDHQVMGVYPYDGDELPAATYLGHLIQGRYPIPTGRPDPEASWMGRLLGRVTRNNREYPHARLQAHDYIIHFLMHELASLEIRGVSAGFYQSQIDRGPGPVGDGTSPLTAAEVAGQEIAESHWSLTAIDAAKPEADIYGAFGAGLYAMNRIKGAPQLDRQTIAGMVARNAAHVAIVADTIRQHFSGTPPA